MRRWPPLHFPGSRGCTTYVRKAKYGRLLHPPFVVEFVARQCDTLCSPLNVSGTFFFLCSLRFVATSFIFSAPFFALFCPLRLALPPCSLSSVCLSAISSLYMSAGTRHSVDKRQHLVERKPCWLLDPGGYKRRRST